MILKTKHYYGRFIGNPLLANELFENLSKNTKKKLIDIRKRKQIQKGEIVSHFGDFPKEFYILQKGQARMTFNNDLIKKKSFRLVNNKEIIGLTQFLSNSPNEMNVMTLTTCNWDVFAIQDFFDLLRHEPNLSFRLAQMLSSDIQNDLETFTSISF